MKREKKEIKLKQELFENFWETVSDQDKVLYIHFLVFSALGFKQGGLDKDFFMVMSNLCWDAMIQEEPQDIKFAMRELLSMLDHEDFV